MHMKKATLNSFPVSVNYDLSVEDAVAAGKYDESNSDISTKKFPSKRKGTTEMEIVLTHFNCEIGSDEVLRELDKQGLRPAELLELLAFGTKYPDVQREFPVVELGSQASDGDSRCTWLNGSGSERTLQLGWLGVGWHDKCRVAAVHK